MNSMSHYVSSGRTSQGTVLENVKETALLRGPDLPEALSLGC